MKTMRWMAIPLGLFAVQTGYAEVVSSDARSFSSVIELSISAPPSEVYDALLNKVDRWWNAEHSYSASASNFYIEAKPGGCFCERLPNGGVEHMRVVMLQHDKQIRMQGGLGPLQGIAAVGTMDFKFESGANNNTLLKYRYDVLGQVEGGLDKWAPAVDAVQNDQLQRLKLFAEK